MSKPIKETVTVAVVLRAGARNPEGAERVRRAGIRMGMAPVSSGTATVSFHLDRERFEALFGAAPERVNAEPPSGADFGAPPGWEIEGELEVPAEMADDVTAVAVEAPARRLQRRDPTPDSKETTHGQEQDQEEDAG